MPGQGDRRRVQARSALTFRLLRYINWSASGSCEISQFGTPWRSWHAAALPLADAVAGDRRKQEPSALSKTAIVRGRLAERLGAAYMDKADQDNLFIVVFSLLPAMLETPMEEILDKLVLPDSITDALLNQTGMYGPYSSWSRRLREAPDRRPCGRAGSGSAQVNAAHSGAGLDGTGGDMAIRGQRKPYA
jgi:EAL and modified HD-GYP domain-containing signal transduction protein